MNIPLNNTSITNGTFYLALYNEIFINDQRDIGDGQTVELFDRNRTYGALGYALSEKMKIQIGIMKQTTNGWEKYQMQLSLHHNW